MIKRDILNYLNQKVGEIEFPDGTSEDVINAKLAEYSKAPPLPPPAPDVTPRQIRQALIRMGYPLSMVTDGIAALPSPHKELAEVEWEYSGLILRSNPLVSMLAQGQGWTTEQLDDLFKFALTL